MLIRIIRSSSPLKLKDIYCTYATVFAFFLSLLKGEIEKRLRVLITVYKHSRNGAATFTSRSVTMKALFKNIQFCFWSRAKRKVLLVIIIHLVILFPFTPRPKNGMRRFFLVATKQTKWKGEGSRSGEKSLPFRRLRLAHKIQVRVMQPSAHSKFIISSWRRSLSFLMTMILSTSVRLN